MCILTSKNGNWCIFTHCYSWRKLLYCTNKCKGRCLKSRFPDKCIKFCVICCEDCKCVPTNMYEDKHECPCYKDKKNNKGKPKCP
ncbi:putative gibberellin regulated protein [Helianthus anomalus]